MRVLLHGYIGMDESLADNHCVTHDEAKYQNNANGIANEIPSHAWSDEKQVWVAYRKEITSIRWYIIIIKNFTNKLADIPLWCSSHGIVWSKNIKHSHITHILKLYSKVLQCALITLAEFDFGLCTRSRLLSDQRHDHSPWRPEQYWQGFNVTNHSQILRDTAIQVCEQPLIQHPHI